MRCFAIANHEAVLAGRDLSLAIGLVKGFFVVECRERGRDIDTVEHLFAERLFAEALQHVIDLREERSAGTLRVLSNVGKLAHQFIWREPQASGIRRQQVWPWRTDQWKRIVPDRDAHPPRREPHGAVDEQAAQVVRRVVAFD